MALLAHDESRDIASVEYRSLLNIEEDKLRPETQIV